MKLKIGDKLICKKIMDDENCHYFDVDKEYVVGKEYDRFFDVVNISVLSNDGDTEVYFYLNNNDSNSNFVYYLWDYFYTEKELRKMKLDKLNDE